MAKQHQNDMAKLSLVSDHNHAMAFPVPELHNETIEDVANHLPVVLQTTLILDKLINLFHGQISKVIAYDSLHYQHQDLHCEINTASRSHHSCNYRLEMDSVWLGELTLTRRTRFNDTELRHVEDLLCKLVYPLRNCLMYRQVKTAALEDALTGLNNRSAFDASLKREIDLAHRQRSPMALIVLDIDHFKSVNDTYGHAGGDLALQTIGAAILETMRACDMAFRYGGEEFTLILSNTDLDAARLVAERLRVAASKLSCNDGHRSFGFTISLGVAQLDPAETGHILFKRADAALYQAKMAGRNQTVCAQKNH